MTADTSEPIDPVWTEFDAVKKQEEEATEQAYQEVEDWNAALLNQVAGIEDMNLTLVRKLSDGPEDEHQPGDMISLKPKNALLYLRPDTTHKLHSQGEPDSVVYGQGDPYVITGEVPARTKKLIDDMLTAAAAELDEVHSTPDEEVWRGDVAGQPIKFVKLHGIMTSHAFDPANTTESQRLSLRIYRDEDREISDTSESTADAGHTDEA